MISSYPLLFANNGWLRISLLLYFNADYSANGNYTVKPHFEDIILRDIRLYYTICSREEQNDL